MMRYGPIGLAVFMLGVGGCASRGNVELLESQLRQQEDQLYAMHSQLRESESDLIVARRELESLRVQLAERGQPTLLPEQSQSLYRVAGVRVQKFLTGGLDRDGEPGDDLLNVVLAPHDEQGESVKLPGDLEIEVLDLTAPANFRQIGVWRFSSEEVAQHWQSGLTSGFQFRMPWQSPPTSENLVLHARFRTADGRQFGTSEVIRVTPNPDDVARLRNQPPPDLARERGNSTSALSQDPLAFPEASEWSETSPPPRGTTSVSQRDESSDPPKFQEVPIVPRPAKDDFFPMPVGDAGPEPAKSQPAWEDFPTRSQRTN